MTKATGDRQKEGGKINQSLLTLSRVLEKLGNKKNQQMHVNYRDSKLTRLLKPSLAGNARMACVCCISPAMQYAEESRSTLEFASRTMLVTTNAKTNKVTAFDDALVSEFEAELERVRLETAKAEEERLQMEKSLKEARGEIVSLQATNALLSAKMNKLDTLNDETIAQLEEVSAKNRHLVDELRIRDDELDQRAVEDKALEETREENKKEVDRLNAIANVLAETSADLETKLESITQELNAAKEQEARHKKEACELNDSHAIEMSKMKEAHAAEIIRLETEAGDSLRSQQEASEAKVKSIEESHRDELESKQGEHIVTHDMRIAELIESNNNKISEMKGIHDAEINNLSEKMDANLKTLQEKATENIQLMEQEASYKEKDLTDAHESHVTELTEAHTAETAKLRDSHDAQIRSLQETAEERLKELDSKQLIIETLTSNASELSRKLECTERDLEEAIEYRKTERVLLEKRLEAFEEQITDLNISKAKATDENKEDADQCLQARDLCSENIPLQDTKRWNELLASATDRIDELERNNAALSGLLERERKKARARKQETSQRRKMFKAKLSGLADTLKEDKLQLSYNKEESP